MSAIDKEKIFTELRQYHVDAFSDNLANSKMDDLRHEFEQLEDKIVNMLLSLVNGKLAYQDLSGELSSFRNKVKVTKATDRKEDNDRNFFVAKIDHLSKILKLGEDGTFKLKVPRFTKVAK